MEFLAFQVVQALSRYRRLGEIHPILIRGQELGPQTLFRLQLRFPGLLFRLEPQEADWLLHWSIHTER